VWLAGRSNDEGEDWHTPSTAESVKNEVVNTWCQRLLFHSSLTSSSNCYCYYTAGWCLIEMGRFITIGNSTSRGLYVYSSFPQHCVANLSTPLYNHRSWLSQAEETSRILPQLCTYLHTSSLETSRCSMLTLPSIIGNEQGNMENTIGLHPPQFAFRQTIHLRVHLWSYVTEISASLYYTFKQCIHLYI